MRRILRMIKILIAEILGLRESQKINWENTSSANVPLFTKNPKDFVWYLNVVDISSQKYSHNKKISLIATIFNEEKSILKWLSSIENQSVKPDELVIVDGGSFDKTIDLVKGYKENSKLEIKLIQKKCAVAEGRNIAIKNSKYEIVAITDAGTKLSKEWLENLTFPFQIDDKMEVVSGWYEPQLNNLFDEEVARYTVVTDLKKLPIKEFLPSSRSVAIKREILDTIEYYPEWCTLSGEDTQMDLKLKKCSNHWGFVPDAISIWEMRRSYKKLFQQYFWWGRGSSEIDFNSSYYKHLFLSYTKLLLSSVLFVLVASCFASILLFKDINGLFILVSFILVFLLMFAGGLLYLLWKNNKQERVNWSRFVTRLKVKFVIDMGNLRGFFTGLKNRPFLYEKRFSAQKGDTLIFFSNYSLFDSRCEREFINYITKICSENTRIVNIYNNANKRDGNFVCKFNPDFLEEYDVNLFNVRDFVYSNSRVMIGKNRIICYTSGKRTNTLVRALSKKLKSKSSVYVCNKERYDNIQANIETENSLVRFVDEIFVSSIWEERYFRFLTSGKTRVVYFEEIVEELFFNSYHINFSWKDMIRRNKFFRFLVGTKFYLANHFFAKQPSYSLRHWFLRKFLRYKIGEDSSIHMNCFVTGDSISVGRNSVINRRCYLDGRVGIHIGDFVNISPEVYILTLQHEPNNMFFDCKGGEVTIGDYAWIGVRAIILPGVNIGEGAIVAAGAIVNKDVAPYSIVAGVPAKEVKTRMKDLFYTPKYFPFYDTDIIVE
jgi:acetyltransferase-like isoleucine patch superfamily enzyme/cellulose synthase/poly-beta-1,6-N-acetylglucosamine synthase-like glycosyltransferase